MAFLASSLRSASRAKPSGCGGRCTPPEPLAALLATKGFDHRTPIHASSELEIRFNSYSQLSPSVAAPIRINELRAALQVFARWLAEHGRTAASYFQADRDRAHHGHSASKDSGADGGGRHGRTASTTGSDHGGAGSGVASRFTGVRSAVVAKLIGGVGKAPIQLSSMAAPVPTPPEAEEWLEGVPLDEGAVEDMQATLNHADDVRPAHTLSC